MQTDIQIYCNNMNDVRTRVNLVRAVLGGHLVNSPDFLVTEVIFLELRKTLELIAFSSLAAHKDAYAAVHAKFAEHWRAKALLDAIEKLNPDFYPMACEPPVEIAPGRKHFNAHVSGYMTKEDFVLLYDACSEALHTRNPYTTKNPVIDIVYTIEQWLARIRRLLAWHRIKLINGGVWMVNIPDKGDVQVWSAQPTPTFSDS